MKARPAHSLPGNDQAALMKVHRDARLARVEADFMNGFPIYFLVVFGRVSKPSLRKGSGLKGFYFLQAL